MFQGRSLRLAALTGASAFGLLAAVSSACVGEDAGPTSSASSPDADATAATDVTSGDASATDTGASSSGGDATTTARCDPAKDFGPAIVVPELSTGAQNIAARLTQNELTVFFGRSLDDSPRDLYTATRLDIDAAFPDATVMTSLKTGQEEGKPSLTADGKRLYFHRNRASAGTDYDILLAPQDPSSGFATPFALGNAVNQDGTTSSNTDPSVSPDGEELYFTRRVSNAARLFVAKLPDATGNFATASEITTVTTAAHRASPVISADRLTLYFAAGPTPAETTTFVATRASTSADFKEGVPVPNVSAGTNRTEPSFISPDGCVLYLFSNRDVKFQIYRATRPK